MSVAFPLPATLLEKIVSAALAEDLGDAGDITTLATIPADRQAKAVIRAREDGIVASVDTARTAFQLVDPALSIKVERPDGSAVDKGDDILFLDGSARAILTAERVALNFMGHLSGIATATNNLVNAVKGTNTKVVCTRKTTPGLRALEKHAVRCGGGYNHRFGLYDAVMIKDNHIVAAGRIAHALKAAKAATGHTVRIEIEIDTLDQLEEVLTEGADIVLLDNMSTQDLERAVAMASGKVILEASGNITLETVRAVAETGVDVISSGWITHSAPNLDLGLDFVS